MASPENFDLIVIGCGPAGERAGAQAAYFGRRVAIIERGQHMGGSCITTGTVPSKTLRETALYFSGLKQRGLYGIDYSLRENLTVHDFMHHEREVVDMERRRILKNLALHKIELGGLPCVWIEIQTARRFPSADGDLHNSGNFRRRRNAGVLLGVSIIGENATELK